MKGLGKILLLALVSIACFMSHASVAKAEMEDWEDLLDAVGEHVDTDQLIALIPRGLEMISEMTDAADHLLSKRDNQWATLIPTLFNAFLGGKNRETMKNSVVAVTKEFLRKFIGDKNFINYEWVIEPIISISFMALDIIMNLLAHFGTTAAPPTSTLAPLEVGPRDLMR